MKSTPAKIIVIGNDDAMRKSLIESIAVQADLKVIAQCATFNEGKSAIRDLPADIIVPDLCLPDDIGSDLIRLARSQRPDAKIMVISVLGDQEGVVGSNRAGETGFLLKDSRQIDFVKAIREVLDKQSPLSTSIAQFIIQNVPEDECDAAKERVLTKRELDVLWGIAKGYTYNDVAEQLEISKNTVPSHIKNIYRKLDVNSRSEAVFEAIQRGWINIS